MRVVIDATLAKTQAQLHTWQHHAHELEVARAASKLRAAFSTFQVPTINKCSMTSHSGCRWLGIGCVFLYSSSKPASELATRPLRVTQRRQHCPAHARASLCVLVLFASSLVLRISTLRANAAKKGRQRQQ